METREFRQPFREVAEDHRGLLARLDRIEELEDAERIGSELVGLLAILELHFEREEAPDGVFVRVETQDPRLSGEIGSLREEHAAFLQRIIALVSDAGAVARGERGGTELRVGVRSLAAELRAHEAREDALLTDAHYHEEGGGD